MAANGPRRIYLWLGLLVWTVVLGSAPPQYDTLSLNTWSIVAADPATGDVGIAVASCVPLHIDAVAALVPGKGVAATQANVDIRNRNRVFELLKAGRPADAVITEVTSVAHDPQAANRQYGVVTLTGGLQVAGFTGERNMHWAGDRQVADAAVTVQGNILVSEAVVSQTLAAFRAPNIGPVTLPDRLIRALEAGSAAGGDSRCNTSSVRQTASSAFIMVARANQPPFAVANLGDTLPPGPNTPRLYLSVRESTGGANPLVALRQRYTDWRAINLPTCATCDLRPLLNAPDTPTNAQSQPAQPTVAAPRTPTPAPTTAPALDVRQVVQSAFWTVLCLAGVMGILAVVVVLMVRGRTLRR